MGVVPDSSSATRPPLRLALGTALCPTSFRHGPRRPLGRKGSQPTAQPPRLPPHHTATMAVAPRCAAAAAARVVAAVALALAACGLPLVARAQMETPLMGSGSPGTNTTDVYLSVYLDRLLNGAVAAQLGARCGVWGGCWHPSWRAAAQCVDAAERDCSLHPSLRLAVDDLNYHWTGGAPGVIFW